MCETKTSRWEITCWVKRGWKIFQFELWISNICAWWTFLNDMRNTQNVLKLNVFDTHDLRFTTLTHISSSFLRWATISNDRALSQRIWAGFPIPCSPALMSVETYSPLKETREHCGSLCRTRRWIPYHLRWSRTLPVDFPGHLVSHLRTIPAGSFWHHTL